MTRAHRRSRAHRQVVASALRRVACVAWLLAVPAHAVAQSRTSARLEGRITDAATGAPLAGANVLLSGTGASFSALTDSAGRYLLSSVAPGSGTLTVSRRGYTAAQLPVRLEAGGTHVLNATLQTGQVALQEVIVPDRWWPIRWRAAHLLFPLGALLSALALAALVARRSAARRTGVLVAIAGGAGAGVLFALFWAATGYAGPAWRFPLQGAAIGGWLTLALRRMPHR